MPAAILALAPPWLPGAGSVYTPIASLFFLASFSATLAWLDNELIILSSEDTITSKSVFTLVIAGVSAGFAFAAKQNIGIYALLAVLVVVIMNSLTLSLHKKRILTYLLFVAIAFILTSALLLIPLVINGGSAKFIEHGFINKPNFILLGRTSYFADFKTVFGMIGKIGIVEEMLYLYQLTLFILPFLVVGALIFVWWNLPDQRNVSLTVLIFTVAAFLVVFPRADLVHLAAAVPALLVGLAFVWQKISGQMPKLFQRLMQRAFRLWIATGLMLLVAFTVVRIVSGDYRICDLPHFKGVLIKESNQKEMRDCAQAMLKSEAEGKKVFMLTPTAGLYYLISGVDNPSPFDFPIAMEFGMDGEAEVTNEISEGRIQYV